MGEAPLRSINKLLFILPLTLFSLIFGNQAVFAEDSLTLTVSTNDLSMNVLPGNFNSVSQTITASTSNIAGYTIKMATAGSSTDLINQSDDTLTIPTFTLPSGATGGLPICQHQIQQVHQRRFSKLPPPARTTISWPLELKPHRTLWRVATSIASPSTSWRTSSHVLRIAFVTMVTMMTGRAPWRINPLRQTPKRLLWHLIFLDQAMVLPAGTLR